MKHIVESLESKLQAAIPGARIVPATGVDKWRVIDAKGTTLASAYSQREAANKAIELEPLRVTR